MSNWSVNKASKNIIINWLLVSVLFSWGLAESNVHRASRFYSYFAPEKIKELNSWFFLQEDEFLIDTGRVYAEDDRGQTSPKIVKGNNYYLIIYWDDQYDGNGACVEGVRISFSGVLIDSGGIQITERGISHSGYGGLDCEFDGNKFLVVWDQDDDDYNIYGKLVYEDGTVDTVKIPISTNSANQIVPAISFDGTNFFVVWHDSRSGNIDIYGARIATSGNVLDPNGILIYEGAGNQVTPAIAFDGVNYLVVWNDQDNIKGARITPPGLVLDTVHIAGTTDVEARPQIHFSSGSYLVVWQRGPSNYSADIYGARVRTDGTVLDPDGFPISTASNGQYFPDVFSGGGEFLVCWADDRGQQYYPDLYGARVDTSGNVLDPNGIQIFERNYNNSVNPSISFTDTTYFAVWDYLNTGYARDIFGTRITRLGNVLDPQGIDLSYKCNTQTQPSIAYDGNNYLSVWADFRKNTQWDIYGMRVSSQGNLLDTISFPICVANSYQLGPAVCFNHTYYFATWMDFRSGSNYYIYGARITHDGTVLDPNGFIVNSSYVDLWYPSVAFGNEYYLVVYDNSADFFPQNLAEILGSVVDTAGNIVDNLQISFGPYNEFSADVAFDSTNFFVVWQESRDEVQFDIYGARVSEQGTLLDPNGILISSRTGNEGFPRISYDGRNYLVVWSGEDGQSWNVYGARVTPEGAVLDPDGFPISEQPSDEYLPDLGFFVGDSCYLVCWQDWRNGDADIYMAKVVGTGISDTAFLFSRQPYDQWYPSLPSVISDNRSLVVWSNYAPSPYGTQRIWGKFYTETGIAEKNEKSVSEISSCYPNPFGTQVKMVLNKPNRTDCRLKFYDVMGRLVDSFILKAGVSEYHWNTAGLCAGIYFLKLEDNNHKERFYKLVKINN